MRLDSFDSNVQQAFNSVRDPDESIFWTGRPKLVPFVASGIPFLVFGCLWGAFDLFGFIIPMSKSGNVGPMSRFLIPFFLLHLSPFYGSILNLIRLVLVHKNTIYAITNKRLMIRSGFFGIDFKSIDYDRIANIEVNVNPLERMFDVGSIKIFTGETVSTRNGYRPISNGFSAIENPYDIFKKIKSISVDVKTDWNYPNDLRPDENPGYQTQYKPRK